MEAIAHQMVLAAEHDLERLVLAAGTTAAALLGHDSSSRDLCAHIHVGCLRALAPGCMRAGAQFSSPAGSCPASLLTVG